MNKINFKKNSLEIISRNLNCENFSKFLAISKLDLESILSMKFLDDISCTRSEMVKIEKYLSELNKKILNGETTEIHEVVEKPRENSELEKLKQMVDHLSRHLEGAYRRIEVLERKIENMETMEKKPKIELKPVENLKIENNRIDIPIKGDGKVNYEMLLSTWRPPAPKVTINQIGGSTPNAFTGGEIVIRKENKKVLDRNEIKKLNGLLMNCSQMGNLRGCQDYIEKGADAFEKAGSCAASGGHKDILLLMERMLKENKMNTFDMFKKGALAASKSGNIDLVIICLEKLGTPKEVLEECLVEATKKNHKNLVFRLQNGMPGEEQMTLKRMNGLLLNYSQVGNLEEVKKYIKMGANYLNKALACACSGGQKEIAKFLIESGADDFNSAAIASCKSGNVEMLNMMFQHGAKNFKELMFAAEKREQNDELIYAIKLAAFQTGLKL